MKRSLKETLGAKTGPNSPEAENKIPQEVESLVDKYRGYSENELMDALLSETRKRKTEGSYDAASVRSGVSALLPMLNGEQRKKLASIIGRMEDEGTT